MKQSLREKLQIKNAAHGTFMHLIFWQNCQSILQVAHIDALIKSKCRVTWVVETDVPVERRKLGWTAPEVEGVKLVVAPSEDTVRSLVSQRDAHHIFSGLRGFQLVNQAFKLCMQDNQTVYLLVENRDAQGWKGNMRAFAYKFDGWRYRSRIGAIFCMGYGGPHGGHKWYRSCGYRDEQIFPYGYFMPAPQMPMKIHGGNIPQLLFAGQYVHRKGGDLLLQALSQLQSVPWVLELVGTGAERSKWESMAHTLGIAARVVFNSALPNAQLMEKVARADLLVLPSRFDGWGAVVNEALMRGVPVVCSNRCGAQDLLCAPWRGETFTSHSVSDLCRVLEGRLKTGPRSLEQTERISRWSVNITGTAAAEYLVKVIESIELNKSRPIAPWLDS